MFSFSLMDSEIGAHYFKLVGRSAFPSVRNDVVVLLVGGQRIGQQGSNKVFG